MKFIWTHNTGYNDIMYSTPYRPYVGAHKNIWEPIILGFQMNCCYVQDMKTICLRLGTSNKGIKFTDIVVAVTTMQPLLFLLSLLYCSTMGERLGHQIL